MAKKRKQYDDDDGRVIVKMNVEGMPWHVDKPLGDDSIEKRAIAGTEAPGAEGSSHGQGSQLSRKETFQIMLASMKYALIASLIFIAAMVLFVLFCTEVWFK